MFGDKILAGEYVYYIDEKNRMFLPANTGREKGDTVYLCYDNDIECYTIYSEKAMKGILNGYKEKIDSAKNIDELKQYKLMLLEYSKSILKQCVVDAQGRIVLHSDIIPNQNVHIIGSHDYLVLIPETLKKKK